MTDPSAFFCDLKRSGDWQKFGIGLAVAHGIVTEHRGAISVVCKIGQGTVFTPLLQACHGPAEDDAADSADLPGGTERIILADDEASIMRVARRRLEKLGYRVKGTTDPLQALQILQPDPFAFDLVVTDMAMPRMTGDELAVRPLRLRPKLPIIMCTGSSEALSEQRARRIGIFALLIKPVVWADFAAIIRRTLDTPQGGT